MTGRGAAERLPGKVVTPNFFTTLGVRPTACCRQTFSMRTRGMCIAETMASQRLTLWLVGGFAALALVLVFVGIYGVMSYSVTERLHEIGVRVALGAQSRDVLRLGHGMKVAATALVAGILGAR